MTSVLITFPTSPSHPFLHKGVVFTSWKLMADTRYEKKMIIPTHNPFENNLHHIVNDFMGGDYDFWLSIDADNPPMKNPLDLVEDDLDIVGFPTPVWHFTGKSGERPLYWNGYHYISEKQAYTEHHPREGLWEVDAVGTGCFMVARRVFENSEMRKAPFVRVLNEDGTVDKGNDIAFCERAKAQGFKVFCHYGYPCFHFNLLELNEIVAGFQNV